MDIDICRTASGRLCERGVKKGGICSQHGGSKSPKSNSPSSNSPKSKSPKQKTPPFPLENLTKDPLILIMLELPREQLNALCKTSRKYANICRSKEFQDLYNKKHQKQMFFGKLTWNKINDRVLSDRYEGKDERENTLTIRKSLKKPFYKEFIFYNNAILLEENKKNAMLILLDSPEPYFSKIGKSQWIAVKDGYNYVLDSKSTKEFYDIVRKEITKIEDKTMRDELKSFLNWL